MTEPNNSPKDLSNYSDEEISQAFELFPSLWCAKYDIKTSTGIPFEFEKRKFMKDFLNDMSPKQVLLKPPQIGATETEIIKVLYICKKKKKDIIYTLPTDSDAQEMVSGKMNRIIANNPLLQNWTHDHDTIERKQVGNNIIYIRGTFTNKKAMMVSSGLNVHDEVDASDASVITQYETRLEAQEREEDKWRWYFSHPSLSGHGVDVYWQQSDKKEWHITCPHCGKEQYLQWPDNIDMQRGVYICSSCKGELSDEVRMQGKWKPTAQGLFSGYHVSQLMLYNKSAQDIINAYNDPQKDKQYFYNYVLGLPYIGSDDKIEPKTVLQNVVEEVNTQEDRTIIGVDTGLGLHMVCMNKQGVFYFEEAKEITASQTPYKRLEELMGRFPRSIVIIDQGGELQNTVQLQMKYPGRVFLCYYRKDRKSIDLYNWGEGDEFGKVVVDRNRHLTLLVEQMRDIGTFRLQGTMEEWYPFAEQWGNIYREKIATKEVKDKDDKSLYGAEYVWKRNGPDHFVHALGYAYVGFTRFKEDKTPAKILGNNPLQGIQSAIMVNDTAKVLDVKGAAAQNRVILTEKWEG